LLLIFSHQWTIIEAIKSGTRGRKELADPCLGVAKVLAWPIAQLRKRSTGLKNRYGPGYAYALLVVTFPAFFSPMPGTTLAGVALVIVTGEIHRAISNRRGIPKTIARKELIMSINCDFILQESATPAQLNALGSALWRWCARAAANTGVYRSLDNQVLADLITGIQPTAGQTPRQAENQFDGVHIVVRDDTSRDRQATVASLRREIPTGGVADIVVSGVTWNLDCARDLPL
jgi:hypothetical protein